MARFFTPSALRIALIVRVWTLGMRLTAMVLPTRFAGWVMPEDGRVSTSNVFGAHVAASITSRNGGSAGAWPTPR